MGKKSKAARKRAHLAATAALARMQQQQQQQQHQGRPAAGGLPPSKKPKMSAAAAVGSAAPSAGAQRPAPPASRPAMGDLVQAGWVSAHKAGAPFVMWKRYGTPVFTGKVAAFDLDGTLLLQQSLGHPKYGPMDAGDWRFFNTSVPDRVAALVADGYEVCVLNNQGTIRDAFTGASAATTTARVDAAVAALGVPCTVVFCTAAARDASNARKPGGGMWDFYASPPARPPAAPPVDPAASFYVGDAAGRPAGANTARPDEADFADSDAAFAAGVGLAFHTPEEMWGPADPGDPTGGAYAGKDAGTAARAAGAAARAAVDAVKAAAEAARKEAARRAAITNAGLASLFFRLANQAAGDRHRRTAFSAAGVAIGGLATPAFTMDLAELAALPGIGKGCLARISEWQRTGDIAEARAADSGGGGGGGGYSKYGYGDGRPSYGGWGE